MERDRLLSPQELEALLGTDDESPVDDAFELLFTPDEFVCLVALLQRVAGAAFEEATVAFEGGIPLRDLQAGLVAPERLEGLLQEGDVLRSFHFDRGLEGRLCFRLAAPFARQLAARLLESDDLDSGVELPPTHVAALTACFDRFALSWNQIMHRLYERSCRIGRGKARVWPGKARKLLAPWREEEHLLEVSFEFGGSTEIWPTGEEGSFWMTLPLARSLAELHRRRGATSMASRARNLVAEDPEGGPAKVEASPPSLPHSGQEALGTETGGTVTVAGVMGRARLSRGGLARLRAGQVLSLDRLAGELVDLEAEGRVVAKGEVVVKDDHVAVKLLSVDEIASDRSED